ncbi:MAG: peptidoglycan-binding protein [Clostridia bacterium]|nr:peptidoglycan-binding protein [Clostridia bacterium]MBQ9252192.1 peptidoglycan-binding protein [Clostridia bacterium]
MNKRTRWAGWMLAMMLAVASPAAAYQPGTLHSGMKGEEVKTMQIALIAQGYLGGTPDGIFGTNTEKAVKKFQRANQLKADGLAGAKTLEMLYQKAGGAGQTSATPANDSGSAAAAPAASTTTTATTATAGNAAGGLFGGDYTTLRQGATGSRVVALQKQLIALGYLKGNADGKYGKQTAQAVKAFQKANKLTADGLAGNKTLRALEMGDNTPAQSEDEGQTASSNDPSSTKRAQGPSGSKVKLLHWFNDIKPTLKSGQTLYIYEPSSGQGWNLRIYSCGRHCDAEPVTSQDTANMLQAFGGKNTWSQKAVYVKLPNGTWTIGSTHDMPHLSGAVKDNNFDGHLCVHFLRTMSEAQKNDPSYGVSNQKTIRAFWKSLTGETISQ